MRFTQFITPWGNEVRALERSIIKYRAMQMVLTVHYAEEINRILVAGVQAQDSFNIAMGVDNVRVRLPEGTRKISKKALKIWRAEGLLSKDEADRIPKLIDFRNDIAHQMHHIMADMSNNKAYGEILSFAKKRKGEEGEKDIKVYNYAAMKEMRETIKLLNAAQILHNFDDNLVISSMFKTTERVLLCEIKALSHKIEKLQEHRRVKNVAINKELKTIHHKYRYVDHPSYPLKINNNGKLTARGAEYCYRLFDNDNSTETVAYALELTIASARNRKRLWAAAGGKERQRIVASDLSLLAPKK